MRLCLLPALPCGPQFLGVLFVHLLSTLSPGGTCVNDRRKSGYLYSSLRRIGFSTRSVAQNPAPGERVGRRGVLDVGAHRRVGSRRALAAGRDKNHRRRAGAGDTPARTGFSVFGGEAVGDEV